MKTRLKGSTGVLLKSDICKVVEVEYKLDKRESSKWRIVLH